MVKICPVCGQIFDAEHPASKYCSARCKKEGSRAARRKWEEKTHYRAAVKEKRKREQARQKRIDQEAARMAQKSRESDTIPPEIARLSDKLDVLEEIGGNSTPEYWDAFKEYEQATAAEEGRESTMTVNGVRVNDPDFTRLVLKSLKSINFIVTKA